MARVAGKTVAGKLTPDLLKYLDERSREMHEARMARTRLCERMSRQHEHEVGISGGDLWRALGFALAFGAGVIGLAVGAILLVKLVAG